MKTSWTCYAGTQSFDVVTTSYGDWMGVGVLFVCYTPRNEVRGGILDSACLSVCLSVCQSGPSVCLLTFSCPVASTVQDGFFPYLVQKINSMRGCVACDDL